VKKILKNHSNFVSSEGIKECYSDEKYTPSRSISNRDAFFRSNGSGTKCSKID